MSSERMDCMQRGAFLINYSRGSVVDVNALAERLRDGRIGGAAVDVFPKEPKDKDTPFVSPLQGLPTVILTPHIGGSTEEAQETIAVDVADKLVRYLERGTTLGAVNFPELNLAPHIDCHRVLHVHHDHPGVLVAINAVFAAEGINITGQHLQTKDRMGYVVLDIETVPGERILPPLRAIEGTIATRILY
jgi:D-3-phosphoglycerate dehydrogenase